MSGSPFEYVLIGSLIGASGMLLVWRLQRRKDYRSAATLRDAIGRIAAGGCDVPTTELTGIDRSILLVLNERLSCLRSRLERLERERDLVMSRVGDGVFITDADRIVLHVNQVQAERLGLREEQVIGRSLIEVLHDHEVDDVARRCLTSHREERALVETGGAKRLVQASATPLAEGQGCVVVLHDRTELRRLEKVRRDFVANISHELRTPLATLKLLSETLSLSEHEDTALVRDYLGRIEVEVDRLTQMVDELGELSLIETGQLVLERAPVKVAGLVRRAVERLQAQAERADLKVVVEVPAGIKEPCGDERRLEQVLVNLLHNAIKFTPPGGSISVVARDVDGEVQLAVSDTGVGVAREDLERIFERFYKADRSRSGSGTGLGLAIARHIVDLHGGRIWAESEAGRGSTFCFTIPHAGPVPGTG